MPSFLPVPSSPKSIRLSRGVVISPSGASISPRSTFSLQATVASFNSFRAAFCGAPFNNSTSLFVAVNLRACIGASST